MLFWDKCTDVMPGPLLLQGQNMDTALLEMGH